DEDIAHHRELAAPAQGEAADGGDDRFAHIGQSRPAGEPVGLVRGGEVEVRHLLDVGTGGEGLVAAGDDDRLDLVIGVERGGRIGDVGEHLQVERVERLRPVDGDRGDAGVDIGEDGFVFAHENTFSSWSV